MNKKARIALFSSGRGSNFDAIVRNRESLNLEITGLICDRKEAPVLNSASKLNIPTLVTTSEDEILGFFKETGTEWAILAGYMRIVSPALIETLRSPRGHSRITNIHPSLLPAFPGLDGYRQAFEYGCKVAGVTIHLVEKELDQGPVLAQESFSISQMKSLTQIEECGLAIEHRLYSETLSWVLKEQFQMETRMGRHGVRQI